MSLWSEIKRAGKTEVRRLRSDNTPDAMTESCERAAKYDDFEEIKIGRLGKPFHEIDRITANSANYLGCVDSQLCGDAARRRWKATSCAC